MERPATGKPLEPLLTVTGSALVVVGTLLGICVLAALFGSGSVFGWGAGAHEVCVIAPNGELPAGTDLPAATDLPSGAGLPAHRTEPGVRRTADAVRLCATAPSVAQRAFGSLTEAPTAVIYLSALVLLYRLARTGERCGPFSSEVTRGARRLGYFLILGGAAAAVAEAMAHSALYATMVTYPTRPTDWINGTHLPVGIVITGIGLLTVARLLRIGVTMREEIETTV